MLRKHEPVSEESMNHVSPRYTICETLRSIYHSTADESIRLKCRTATAMAKAMTARLTEYKRNQTDLWDYKAPTKPIDVLFLAYDDNANTGYRFMQCARHLGLQAVMFKGKRHPFGYPVQAPVLPLLSHTLYDAPTTVLAPGLESLIESARVVHLIASTIPVCKVKWGNVVVQHGGTVYRQFPGECNSVFNQIASHTIIQCPDLLGLGAKNEHWIYYPVDTNLIRPDFSPKGRPAVVGHFPSNADVKGWSAVERVCRKLQDEGVIKWVGSTERVNWKANLDRMRACDIIVEGCNAHQGTKAYGEWGNTALEACALGCAVVTHCLSQDKYRETYGCELGFTVANDEQALGPALRHLANLHSNGDLRDEKERGRKWVEQNHSIPATANRLWDEVYKEFFS